MPGMQPMVRQIDELIAKKIPNLQYAIKWGNAFYVSQEHGWLIEVGAFAVSVNIVFLSGADFDPLPPLGTDERSRYIKLRTMDEVLDPKVLAWIVQAGSISGWK